MQFLKKALSLIASAFLVLILSGFVNLKPVYKDAGQHKYQVYTKMPVAEAHHTDAIPCYDMTGLTAAVLSPAVSGREAGVADAGQLNFSLPENHDYQACAETNVQDWRLGTQPADATGSFIKGWAWNTNLGYISFYCKDGNNWGTNNCGTIDYAAVRIPAATGGSQNYDELFGFAWGDNIGWISMGCKDGTNLGTDCSNINYGVKLANADGVDAGSCGIINRGDLYGYGWNDSVGWINFCGAQMILPSDFRPDPICTDPPLPGDPCYGDERPSCRPATETCDGYDNNCDLFVDEYLSQTCINSCGKENKRTCSAGDWLPEICPADNCDPKIICVPETEICDGIDNDCDKFIDEEISTPCTNECGNISIKTCSAGVWSDCDSSDCPLPPPPCLTEPCPPPGGDGSDSAGAAGTITGEKVYANGTDSYKIIVRILNNGVAVTDPSASEDADGVTWHVAGHTIAVSQINWRDTLRTDQVSYCDDDLPPGGATASTPDCVYDAAIKPTSADFRWSNDESALVAELKAIAPTAKASTPPDLDRIVLESISVTADRFQYDNLIPETAFRFSEPAGISNITGVSPATGAMVEGEISLVRASSEPVYLTAERHSGAALPEDAAISIFTQIHKCGSSYDFQFDEDGITGIKDENGDPEPVSTGTSPDIDRLRAVCSTAPLPTIVDIDNNGSGNALGTFPATGLKTSVRSIYADVPPGATPAEGMDLNAIGLRTRVEYTTTPAFGSKPIKYFSKMVSDGSVLNQAAYVKGSVRIDTQKMLKQNVVAQTMGNDAKDTQTKREKFYRAIKSTMGQEVLATVPGVSGGALTINQGTILPQDGLLYYNRSNITTTDPTNTKPCKIILDSSTAGEDLNFSQDVTIVSEGCDVFIDQNVYHATNRTGKLGIIALEDLSMTGDRKGGNVYICHRVTDLEANIVADNSVFGYGVNQTDCGPNKNDPNLIDEYNGLPMPPKNGWRKEAVNQLTIVGSLLSNNTYGGSLLTPPLLGDGTRITTPEDIYKTRLHDINFLRYAYTQQNPDGSTCWQYTDSATAVTLSKTLSGTNPDREIACTNGNNPDSVGIVNIIYNAPSKDMKVFSAVK